MLTKGTRVKVVPLPTRTSIMAPWVGREGTVDRIGCKTGGVSLPAVDLACVLLDATDRNTPAMTLARVSVESHLEWFRVDELEEIR